MADLGQTRGGRLRREDYPDDTEGRRAFDLAKKQKRSRSNALYYQRTTKAARKYSTSEARKRDTMLAVIGALNKMTDLHRDAEASRRDADVTRRDVEEAVRQGTSVLEQVLSTAEDELAAPEEEDAPSTTAAPPATASDEDDADGSFTTDGNAPAPIKTLADFVAACKDVYTVDELVEYDRAEFAQLLEDYGNLLSPATKVPGKKQRERLKAEHNQLLRATGGEEDSVDALEPEPAPAPAAGKCCCHALQTPLLQVLLHTQPILFLRLVTAYTGSPVDIGPDQSRRRAAASR